MKFVRLEGKTSVEKTMTPASRCFAWIVMMCLALGSAAARAAEEGQEALAAPGPAALSGWVPWGQARQVSGQPYPVLEKGQGQAKEFAGAEEAVAGEAAAAEVPLGATNANEELNELRQSAALLAGGGFAVTWMEGAAPIRSILLQYVRPDGSQAFSGGGLPVTSAAANYGNPVVAAHPRAGAFVAFSHWNQVVGGNRILVQSFDGAGRPRWPGEGVAVIETPDAGRFLSEPSLVPSPDGGVYACFMDVPFGSTSARVRCQRFAADGRRLWGDGARLTGGRPGWQVLPKALSDGAGGILVFWRNQRVLFDDDRIDPMLFEGQRFAPDGTRLWGERGKVVRTTRLAESNGYRYNFYDAVSDGQGGAILAFDDWTGRGSGDLDVMAQRVKGDGSVLWGQGVVVASGPASQQLDAVVAAPGGGAVVAVFELVSSTHNRQLLYRLGADGRHVWPRQGTSLPNPQAKALDYAVFGTFQGGKLRMAWTHQREPATFTMDIHLAIFDESGRRLTPRAGLPLTTAEDAQFLRGFLFDPARGVGLAVWNDRRHGSWDDLDAVGARYVETP